MAAFDAVFSVSGENLGADEHVPPIEDTQRVSSSHKDAHDDGDLKIEQMLQQTFTRKVSKVYFAHLLFGKWNSCKIYLDQSKKPLRFQECDLGAQFLNIDPIHFTGPDQEANRCFFIALGVSLKTHPFLLQQLCRNRAAVIRSAIERKVLFADNTLLQDQYREWIQSVTTPGSPVDMKACAICLPEQVFMKTRILIVDKRHDARTNTRVFLFDDPEAAGSEIRPTRVKNEVMIGWNGHHFTILQIGRTISSIVGEFRKHGSVLGGAVNREITASDSVAMSQFLHSFIKARPDLQNLFAGLSGLSGL